MDGGGGFAAGGAAVARFSGPQGVWNDGVNLYIADTFNSTIRKVVIATGATSTFAGNAGNPGFLTPPPRS